MTVLATSKSQVWPRFGHEVVYQGQRYRIVAAQVAPTRGLVLRPIEASDAAADQLLPYREWRGFRWDGAAERWRAA